MCFGGGGGNTVTPAPAPAPTNTPAPPGTDANQRFQQIRAGLAGGKSGAIIDDSSKDSLNPAKGTTVLGG